MYTYIPNTLHIYLILVYKCATLEGRQEGVPVQKTPLYDMKQHAYGSKLQLHVKNEVEKMPPVCLT